MPQHDERTRALSAAGLSFAALQAVLRREEQERMSDRTQAAYLEAEADGGCGWLEVTSALQERLLADAGVPPTRMAAALHLLRCAASLFGDALGDATPLYARHNRAARGALCEGDPVPELRLHCAESGAAVPLRSALGDGMPTLLVAGSWT